MYVLLLKTMKKVNIHYSFPNVIRKPIKNFKHLWILSTGS